LSCSEGTQSKDPHMSDNGTCDVPRLTLVYFGVKGKPADSARKT
jgi:hypothetical protein